MPRSRLGLGLQGIGLASVSTKKASCTSLITPSQKDTVKKWIIFSVSQDILSFNLTSNFYQIILSYECQHYFNFSPQQLSQPRNLSALYPSLNNRMHTTDTHKRNASQTTLYVHAFSVNTPQYLVNYNNSLPSSFLHHLITFYPKHFFAFTNINFIFSPKSITITIDKC